MGNIFKVLIASSLFTSESVIRQKSEKYMLQKMFPQNGAKVPEIRFDGYTYDWEQRKFGDYIQRFLKRMI